jgi:hypothetical protein
LVGFKGESHGYYSNGCLKEKRFWSNSLAWTRKRERQRRERERERERAELVVKITWSVLKGRGGVRGIIQRNGILGSY